VTGVVADSASRDFSLLIEKAAAPEFDARFVLSAASPDRVKDTIDPAAYKPWVGKRLPALLGHERGAVIGYWDQLKVVADTLVGDIKFVSTQLGQMVKTWLAEGVPLGASIGFRGKGTVKEDGGVHFTQLDLGEVSLVTVPAHPRAVQIAKQFGFSLDDAGQLPARARAAPAAQSSAVAARSPQRKGNMATKSISELVVETQTAQVAARDKLTEATTKLGEIQDTASEEFTTQKAVVDQLTAELEAIEGKLTTLKNAETRLATGAAATQSAAAIVKRDSAKETENLLGKLALCVYESRVKGIDLDKVAATRFPESRVMETLVKAAQNPAMSNVAGYAQELTRISYAQLQEMLRPASILPAVVPAANSYSFDGAVSIYVPVRAGTLTDAAGAFRAEGDPIRVGGLQFTSKPLTPKSMGVILTATEEMLRRSTIDLASYFQSAIVQDTGLALDQLFVSNTAGSATQPAGSRNGLVAGDTRASTGATADKIVADLKTMLTAMATENMGSGSTRWLMHPKNWFAVSMLITATGAKQFPETQQQQLCGIPVVTSVTIPTNVVLLIDFAQYAFAMGNPSFVASNVATLHEENTTPLPLATGASGAAAVTAAPVRSLFQTYSWALRMVMDVDWTKIRTTGPVQELTAVAW
jgi:HK97 family phage major capsid protein/HK97 family phage prohead protease